MRAIRAPKGDVLRCATPTRQTRKRGIGKTHVAVRLLGLWSELIRGEPCWMTPTRPKAAVSVADRRFEMH